MDAMGGKAYGMGNAIKWKAEGCWGRDNLYRPFTDGQWSDSRSAGVERTFNVGHDVWWGATEFVACCQSFKTSPSFPSTIPNSHLTTVQFLSTRIIMAVKTVEIKPFQDQKPGTYVFSSIASLIPGLFVSGV
jgi:hypothetical protein